MPEVNLQNYHLQLSLMGHKDTPMYPDKPQSSRYAAIPFQIFLGHNTPVNENNFTVK